MVLDIDRFRPEKGGNPEAVKKNQKDRFSDETMVDKIIEADEKWRRGMLRHLLQIFSDAIKNRGC